jgi:hypothetical protein
MGASTGLCTPVPLFRRYVLSLLSLRPCWSEPLGEIPLAVCLVAVAWETGESLCSSLSLLWL